MAQPQGVKILIVDDDPVVNDTFATMLTLGGYQVRTAPDVMDGLREFDAYQPDVLFLHLRMPLAETLRFLRHVRAPWNYRDTPVAVVTGDYSLDESVAGALRELHAAVYFKPLWFEDLHSITQELLKQTCNSALPRPFRSGNRLKLLLVDDCAAERDFYQLALERDFTILTATRGDEAVIVASREHPDAIVLDVRMPVMDGWDACATIKSNAATADIPVILVTGESDRDLSQHAIAVGASALLRKPCRADTLRDFILEAVNRDVDRVRH